MIFLKTFKGLKLMKFLRKAQEGVKYKWICQIALRKLFLLCKIKFLNHLKHRKEKVHKLIGQAKKEIIMKYLMKKVSINKKNKIVRTYKIKINQINNQIKIGHPHINDKVIMNLD